MIGSNLVKLGILHCFQPLSVSHYFSIMNFSSSAILALYQFVRGHGREHPPDILLFVNCPVQGTVTSRPTVVLKAEKDFSSVYLSQLSRSSRSTIIKQGHSCNLGALVFLCWKKNWLLSISGIDVHLD